MLRPRCRSVFQNYQNFQAWDQIPQQSHYNLLTKLNKNLNNYQNKYKQYMHIKQKQFKQNPHPSQCSSIKQESDVPFLPYLKNDPQQSPFSKSRQFNKVKVIEQESQLRDSQIFCERTNNHLKLKTISFQKQKKIKCSFQRRKFSLRDSNQLQVQKFFNKQNQNVHLCSDIFQSNKKLTRLKSLQCKQLKHRFKKAFKKIKLVQVPSQQKMKQNNENIIIKKRSQLSSIVEQIQKQKQKYDYKSNEFSDKKFYEQYSRQKFKIHR